jgi:hypothetical protein
MPKGFGRSLRIATLGLLGALWMSPTVARAQTQERWSKLLDPATGEALPPDRVESQFRLFGSADKADFRMNLPGRWCWENQHGETNWVCPTAIHEGSAGFTYAAFRNTSFNYGVPPSQWEKAKALVPSLENAGGGGWSVFSGYTEEVLTDVIAADGQLGPLAAGATARADGSCADITTGLGGASGFGYYDAGDPLLPSSNCPETWGSLGYVGGQLIPTEAYDSAFAVDGPAFAFDFWKYPGAYAEGVVDPQRALGFHVVYGELSDWVEEKRAQYGAVMPGGEGDPLRQGWPLGLRIREDAFVVPIPPLRNVMFVQTVIVNRSEDVYGVPIDYDSLYIGLASSVWWNSNVQNAAFYFEPWSGMMKSVLSGSAPACNGANPATDILCYTDRGDPPGFDGLQWGGGYIILKSPIGDLRNKLFTRKPDGTPCTEGVDLFCDPDHPLAGDTITFNIAAPCGFRSCTQTVWRGLAEPDWQRRMFGLISGITSHAIGARTATTISDRDWWHLTRSYTHPNRVDDPNDLLRRDQGFNTHIPGVDPETMQGEGPAPIWDWNKDMVPDTLFYSNCNPSGCSDTWSDTLRGPPGAGPYVNAYGNVGTVVNVGPVSLAAGDTTSWVMAYYIGDTQADVDRFAENALGHYLAFYLAPGPPAPTSIRSVDVVPGDPTERQLTLFIGDESEAWVDPFLAKAAEDFKSDPIGIANPWLSDTLAFLSENNLQAVHVFRSCDGGSSFDADGDCDGDPATGGDFGALGWLPYQTFDIDDLGEIPNIFVDDDIPSGTDVLYSIVAETRGAEPIVLNPTTGRGEVLEVAPKLFNGLSTSTGEPNVSLVYVPTSLQAGAERSSVTVTDQQGSTPIAPDGFHDLSLVPAGDDVVTGTYNVYFGATAEVVDSIFADRTASRLTLWDEEGTPTTYTTDRVYGITTAGGSVSEEQINGTTVLTTTFDGLTVALLAGDEPLLASDQLTGDVTTPGSFITRSDWPRLLLAVNDQPGDFNGQFFVNPTGDTVPDQARPGVIWGGADAAPGGLNFFGDVTFAWEGEAFGPGAPFTLDFFTPENTEQQVAASLEARSTAQQTLAPSAETLALARAALTVLALNPNAINEEDIIQADLPFSIENLSFDRSVDAIMLKRTASVLTWPGGDTRLMGTGTDTVRIGVPSDKWLPADPLILVETDDQGTKQVTWARSLLACFEIAQFTRQTCNPVAGRGASLYLSPRPGQEQHVQYFNALTSESRYAFDAASAVSGDMVEASAVGADLAAVKVVPNPYIVSADTDRGNAGNILFTNLPGYGRIRVYTVSGQFVQEITWEPDDLADEVAGAVTTAAGDIRFDMRTREGNEMATRTAVASGRSSVSS